MSIAVNNVGKAYKYYASKWSRIAEKLQPGNAGRHTKKWVLKEISFTVQAGESVGIVGVNGAGKSTLLKLLTGTTQPTCGNIQIHGRVAALLELGMGFHPDFTGRQNVYMAGLMMGLGRDQISVMMPEIERFADIGDYIRQPVRIYSSGMQMRLAFAVATAARPDILIVDEALSVGDSRFQAKCYARIAEFKQQGTTLLLVSHSAGDIVRHCDRAIFLKDGVIGLDGTARDVTNRYMDELFGKQEKVHAVAAADVAPETPLADNQGDVFHTRHGYRPEEYRWGHGGARIIDYQISSNGVPYPVTIDNGAQTDVYLKVQFDVDFDSVVPGILLKTLDGLFLYGTNSFLASEGRENIAVARGEVQVFKFSFPLHVNSGDYLLSLGISAGNPRGNMTPLDRRYDSVMLHVSKHMEFWGVIDLNARFESYPKKTG
ncbi:ABC transporter ATP-binding protein [Pantoea sp. B65]|uniref:ABC transporter ATP-binding protein n=1 Tax=Pantoea sp. B65 TaxID=2813359 RepID=UPI0039B5E3E4